MPDQSIALATAEPIAFEPQDRWIKPKLGDILGAALSLIVIGAALYQARNLELANIFSLIPSSVIFWAVFAVSYLAGPASDWIIFRRLWGVGPEAFGALLRKLIYNELLVGYLGEVYFYGWARRNLKFVNTPFGAVKDVAILSAIAGNLTTLFFLAVAWPFVRLLPLDDHASAIGWSLAFVIGSSLVVLVLRGKIFSLHRAELRFVFFVHILRILAITFLSAVLWHMVLPDVELGWWIVLVTIRLLISRLPFVPNKDVVFAGIAVLALGSEVQIAELMAFMAGLILVTHVLVGVSFACADLLLKAKANVARTR
jgi:hypothetical protein